MSFILNLVMSFFGKASSSKKVSAFTYYIIPVLLVVAIWYNMDQSQQLEKQSAMIKGLREQTATLTKTIDNTNAITSKLVANEQAIRAKQYEDIRTLKNQLANDTCANTSLPGAVSVRLH